MSLPSEESLLPMLPICIFSKLGYENTHTAKGNVTMKLFNLINVTMKLFSLIMHLYSYICRRKKD